MNYGHVNSIEEMGQIKSVSKLFKKSHSLMVSGLCSTNNKYMQVDLMKESCCSNEKCRLSGPFLKAMKNKNN